MSTQNCDFSGHMSTGVARMIYLPGSNTGHSVSVISGRRASGWRGACNGNQRTDTSPTSPGRKGNLVCHSTAARKFLEISNTFLPVWVPASSRACADWNRPRVDLQPRMGVSSRRRPVLSPETGLLGALGARARYYVRAETSSASRLPDFEVPGHKVYFFRFQLCQEQLQQVLKKKKHL
jgi:hypothetical protein